MPKRITTPVRVSDTLYKVPSDSDADKLYEVTLYPGADPHCNCVAYVMKRNRLRKTDPNAAGDCKHVQAVLKAGGVATPVASEAVVAAVEAPGSDFPSYRPMLAREGKVEDLTAYAEDDNYYLEQKMDGHRLVLIAEPGPKVTVIERKGGISQHNNTFQADRVRDNFKGLESTMVLDGEYLDGILYVFDYLRAGDHDFTELAYVKRRELLEMLFRSWKPDSSAIQLAECAKNTREKLELVKHLLETNAEGVMVKHLDGVYTPGKRGQGFVKAKFTKTVDVFVTDKNQEGKNNYELSVFRKGEPTVVGRCSGIGKDDAQIGEVIEVKYLYLGANDRLVQPTMMGKRTDKKMFDCEFDQLVPTNKTVFKAAIA